MKKIKPVMFVCGGLMAIATLYGAIDLVKSNSSGQLSGLYVEKPDNLVTEESIKKIEEVVPAVGEKEIAKIEDKKIQNEHLEKPKRKINRPIKKEAFHKAIEEKELLKNKELEWESFSRKPVNRKFKKALAATDSAQRVE